jgi:UDP:flavonoid glycosyltransferase YjiC (YdhE family)
LSDDVLTVGDVPHEWLFPKLAAAVHHGGAGTTGATVRAGIPSITVPVLGDQGFWGARLARLGAAPAPIRFAHLSAARLGIAIRDTVTDRSYRERARTLTERVAREDGIGRVVNTIDRLTATSR